MIRKIDGVYIRGKHGTLDNVDFDYNLEQGNGRWTEEGGSFPGDMAVDIVDQPWNEMTFFQNVDVIRPCMPQEGHGVSVSAYPCFVEPDRADHDMDDGYWRVFRLRLVCGWIDSPRAQLPESLTRLIEDVGAGDAAPPTI